MQHLNLIHQLLIKSFQLSPFKLVFIPASMATTGIHNNAPYEPAQSWSGIYTVKNGEFELLFKVVIMGSKFIRELE